MIRKISIGLPAFLLLILLSTGCEPVRTVYDGPDYIMFSDSLYILPVQNSEDYFEIPISATQPVGFDRVLAVEIIDKTSNAIEGRHYQLESNTVRIKAGELAGHVKVRGVYENIGVADSIGFTLRLITDEETQWSLYGIETNVVLQKSCPFDVDTFTGYCVISSTYFNSYMPYVTSRLITSRRDPDNDKGIILENFFYDGFDVKVEFNVENPLHPLLRTKEQIFASTSEAFGTTYGDGFILMNQPALYTSYYSTCEAFMVHYMTLHVPDVGTVGTFLNIIKWISDDEAELLKSQGY